MSSWNPHTLPSAAGKTMVVTGGNAGIGYFIAEQLAAAGAHVVIAARSAPKAAAAIATLRERLPGASVSSLHLDLADTHSLAEAGAVLRALPRLDALILNAGAKVPETQQVTADGVELTFASNQLGNFALIAHTLPALEATADSRIVTMGSLGYKVAQLDLDFPEKRFRGLPVYTASKYAQMLTALELDRRLRARRSPVRSLIAHPGVALDQLSPDRRPALEWAPWPAWRALPARVASQGKDAGAWPAVRAALDPEAEGGSLWGPRFFWSQGAPVREKLPAKLRAAELGRRTWSFSEEHTGLSLLPEEA